MTKLSANFTLAELTVSQSAARAGIKNVPGPAETANLKRLCETVLQPLRNSLGKPIVITSGYRGPAVNRLIGGSSTSAHMHGLAADIHVPGMSSDALMRHIHKLKLPVDQVIDEFGSWVHVGLTSAGAAPRNQYLIARVRNGQTVYSTAKV